MVFNTIDLNNITINDDGSFDKMIQKLLMMLDL